ncbi:RagB/SusD family nutrient uptake outer membrane protein [Tenacibaculum sp. UWU-22]|uniref:RagB/SusD family nutrient uptake outer membrane protein n=1 Tax=Tenacibaculum sp. UWU-22 TaxID=3234187 RepID=UPI0034DB234C
MKNNIKKLYILFVFLSVFTGCNDDILNQLPKDTLVEETTFTSDANFKSYAWGFYTSFDAYNLSQQNLGFRGDLLALGNGSQTDPWLRQAIQIPTTSSLWSDSYKQIRRVNIMLRNTNNGSLDETQRKHWESVGRFFRAYHYFNLVKAYGDVPWLGDLVLTDKSPELYGKRTPRTEVAQHILDDLKFAEANIKADGSGKNTINTNVVRALLSRFGLFEGTWEKYHETSGGTPEKYLQASFDASAELMVAFPSLISNFDLVFNSESLDGKPGIILYKDYIFGQVTHILTSRLRNSAGNWDLTKKAVDKFLCTDGKTRWTSTSFKGDKDPYDEFKNRDTRLYITTTVPYKVKPTGGNKNKSYTWTYDSNPKYREYLDIMAGLSDAEHKAGPTMNWAGFVVKQEPHFRKFNSGQGFNVCYTGYRLNKFYNNLNTGIQNKDFADAPIFRMGEVLLNYAEAAYELGTINQSIIDATINKLRARGGVTSLDISNIPNDPTRDADVDAILWEIRRERAVELLAEGFRWDDLRRWKKFVEYGSQEKLGRWVKNSDYGNKLPIQGGASEGYVSPFGVPPGVPEYYYLSPIPSNEIVLNPNLTQNPDWN